MEELKNNALFSDIFVSKKVLTNGRFVRSKAYFKTLKSGICNKKGHININKPFTKY